MKKSDMVTGRATFDRSFETFLFLRRDPIMQLREFHSHSKEYVDVLKSLINVVDQIDYYAAGLKKPAQMTHDMVMKSKDSISHIEDVTLSILDGSYESPAYEERMLIELLRHSYNVYRVYIGMYSGDDKTLLLMRMEGASRCEIASRIGVSEAAVAKRLSRINKEFDKIAQTAIKLYQQEIEAK